MAAAARELPLRLPRAAEQTPHREDAIYGLLLLLGASVVVWSVTGKPPAAPHAGYALAGFLLWLLGIALLLFPRAPQPVFPGAMAAAVANNSALEKLKHFFSNRHPPAPTAGTRAHDLILRWPASRQLKT